MRTTAIAIGICALTIASCRILPQKDTSPVVARVGTSTLTLRGLSEAIPPELVSSLTPEQKASFVRQWVDGEILYQAAIAEKIDREPAVRTRIEAMRRNMLAAEMISRMSARLAADTQFSDSALTACYTANKASFIRKTDAVRYVSIVTHDYNAAWTVRNAVTADNFSDLGAKNSIAPLPTDFASVAYMPAPEVPKAISDVVFGIKVGGTTSPIQMPDGFYVIRVLDKQHAGDTLPFVEVKNEVTALLSSQSQKSRMENLAAELREKTTYEINLDLVTGTAGTKPATIN